MVAVPAEGQTADRLVIDTQWFAQGCSGLNVPQPDGSFGVRRRKHPAIWAKRHTHQPTGVSRKRAPDRRSLLDIPEPDGSVIFGSCQDTTARAKCDRSGSCRPTDNLRPAARIR